MNESKNILLSSYYTITKPRLLTVGTIIIIMLSFEVLPITGIPLVFTRGTDDRATKYFMEEQIIMRMNT